jgi:hypothetical protein
MITSRRSYALCLSAKSARAAARDRFDDSGKSPGFKESTCKGRMCQREEQDKHTLPDPGWAGCQRTPGGQGFQLSQLLSETSTFGELQLAIGSSVADSHRVSCLPQPWAAIDSGSQLARSRVLSASDFGL